MLKYLTKLSVVLFVLSLYSFAQSQIPDKFENLKVLDADISKAELLENMKSFAVGLGVRCNYCHVGEEGQPLSSFNFKSDAKPTKQTARIMIKMRNAINTTYLTQITKSAPERLNVNCVTCHHGQPKPFTLEQVLSHAFEEGGIDATKVKYIELRKKYYGGFTYNFQENTLILVADKLVSSGNTNAALAILNLNLDYFPKSAFTFYSLGEIYAIDKKDDLAVEQLKKSLALNPNNRRAKRRIEQLSKKGH